MAMDPNADVHATTPPDAANDATVVPAPGSGGQQQVEATPGIEAQAAPRMDPVSQQPSDAETTAAAAVVGGGAGMLVPFMWGPAAMVGGPTLAVALAAGCAVGSTRGGELGEMTRDLGRWGLKARDVIAAEAAELAGAATEHAARLDERHRISGHVSEQVAAARAHAARLDEQHQLSERAALAGQRARQSLGEVGSAAQDWWARLRTRATA